MNVQDNKPNKGKGKQKKQWVEVDSDRPRGDEKTDKQLEPQRENNQETNIPNIATSNAYQALADDQDSDEFVPETPAADLLEMVTSSDVQDVTKVAIKQRLCETARDLDRMQQLRQERANMQVSPLTTAKLQVLSDRIDRARAGVQVPADLVGQPKSTNMAPNSPHPGGLTLEGKLQEAVKLGKHPSAYDFQPGDRQSVEAMDSVSKENWKKIDDDEQDVNYDFAEENDTGRPPDQSSHLK